MPYQSLELSLVATTNIAWSGINIRGLGSGGGSITIPQQRDIALRLINVL